MNMIHQSTSLDRNAMNDDSQSLCPGHRNFRNLLALNVVLPNLKYPGKVFPGNAMQGYIVTLPV